MYTSKLLYFVFTVLAIWFGTLIGVKLVRGEDILTRNFFFMAVGIAGVICYNI